MNGPGYSHQATRAESAAHPAQVGRQRPGIPRLSGLAGLGQGHAAPVVGCRVSPVALRPADVEVLGKLHGRVEIGQGFLAPASLQVTHRPAQQRAGVVLVQLVAALGDVETVAPVALHGVVVPTGVEVGLPQPMRQLRPVGQPGQRPLKDLDALGDLARAEIGPVEVHVRVGQRAAGGSSIQQYNDVRIGYDNNGDGDILDAGDDIQVSDNFDP